MPLAKIHILPAVKLHARGAEWVLIKNIKNAYNSFTVQWDFKVHISKRRKNFNLTWHQLVSTELVSTVLRRMFLVFRWWSAAHRVGPVHLSCICSSFKLISFFGSLPHFFQSSVISIQLSKTGFSHLSFHLESWSYFPINFWHSASLVSPSTCTMSFVFFFSFTYRLKEATGFEILWMLSS